MTPPENRQATRVEWDPAEQRATRSTVVVDSPPAVDRTIEHRFVSVDSDRYQRAHAWAKEQLVRKQPGAVGAVQQLDSLIRQKLAAEAV